MGSSNPNGPPNLNKQSSFPGLPGQAAKPVPIGAPSAQSASDESDTPVSLPTTPAADSSTPASGATSPATSQAGSTTNSHSNNGSSQASSPEEKELEEHYKKNNIPLKYIDNDYTADRAFMPEPLRKAIDTLSISKAQMNVHNEAADEFKSHTEKECLRLNDSCEKKIKGWTSSYETKQTTRLENREAALAGQEAARADAVKEQEVKQTAANQKSIAEEQARIEKLTQELEARKATLAAELKTATIAKTEELAQEKADMEAKIKAESDERKESLDRKVAAAELDRDTKLYITKALETAHEKRNAVGDNVQKQVQGLANATQNVAQTLHYVHQNRVDGLNNGVSDKFDTTKTAFDKQCQTITDDVRDNHEVATAAINRNKVRTHALAQDIVDRHGLKQFRKHKVASTFRDVASTEASEDNPGNWQDKSYHTKHDNAKAYAAEKFPVQVSAESKSRRRLANQPKSHTAVLEALLEEINRQN